MIDFGYDEDLQVHVEEWHALHMRAVDSVVGEPDGDPMQAHGAKLHVVQVVPEDMVEDGKGDLILPIALIGVEDGEGDLILPIALIG